MIDDQSPPGAWSKAIKTEAKRKATNKAIIAMNARIKAAWNLGTPPDAIAKQEGISVSYVEQIGKRWGA
jgi:hypothetical protein